MNSLMRALGAATILAFAGCNAALDFLTPEPSNTVRLVNDTEGDLTVEFFFHDEQEAPEALITEVGQRRQRTLGPGETLNAVNVDCEELQALVITDADLDLGLGLGPSQDTDVLRDGTDFNCGDTLVFTFQNPSLAELTIDFDPQ